MTLVEQEYRTTAGPSDAPKRLNSWIVSGSIALSFLTGTATSAPLATRASFVVLDSATSIGGYEVTSASSSPAGTADAIKRLRSRSGLSWDQIARIFGVSRRSVHKWATGGPMNGRNLERLAELTRSVDSLGSNAREVRTKLLKPNDLGETVFATLVAGAHRVVPAPEGMRVDQLLGARRDDDATQFGRYLDLSDDEVADL